LAVAGIAGVLVAGLAPGAHGFIPLPCADADAPQCMGACVDGQACVSISRGGTATCVCRDVGCCRTGAATCIEDVTALVCLGMGGSWGRFETCADGCTPTGNPNGGECTDASECQSDNCADGVCCDSPCDGPNQACNVTGQVGECANVPAPAPAASHGALALTAGTLIAIAALALLRRRWR
jgi:hypothetical protein